MLTVTLDNILMENGKPKTYALITTNSGETIKIFHRDAKYKNTKARISIDCERDVKIDRAIMGGRKYTPYEKCSAICKWSSDKEWFNSDMFHDIRYANKATQKLSHGQAESVHNVVSKFNIEVEAWM